MNDLIFDSQLLTSLFNFVMRILKSDVPAIVFIVKSILLIIFGILITFSYSNFSFKWFKSKNFLHIASMLPMTAYTITTIIGSNIALSLGMVGALSIIRFRNPVRSSFELIYYFSLLTIGITMTVSFIIALIFLIFILLIPKFINFFYGTETSLNGNIIECNFEIIANKNELKEIEKDYSIKSLTYEVDKDKSDYSIKLISSFETQKQLEIFREKWNDKIKYCEIYKK